MDPQTLAHDWLVWLQGRWDAFLGLQTTLADLQHRAAVAGAQALAAGDQDTHDAAVDAINGLGDLAQLHLETVGELENLGALIPGSGLGQIVPLAYAVALIAAAGAAAYIFGKTDAYARVVSMIEEKIVTPAQGLAIIDAVKKPGPEDRPPSAWSELSATAKWAAVAVLGYVGFQVFQKVRA